MFDMLLLTLNYWLSTALGRLLAGAGLTLAVATGIITLFESNFNGIPSTVASFVNIAGVDVALSLIVSALIARQGLMSAKVFIAKV